MIRALLALCFAVSIGIATPAAATVQGSAGILFNPIPAGSSITVDLNVCIPKTGGGCWTQLPTDFIVPSGSHADAVVSAHGGSGASVTNCQNVAVCNQASVTTPITGATWSSLNGGTTVFTVGTDLTATLEPGHPFAVSGVTCPSGSCYNSPPGTGNGWTVVPGGVTATTVTVAQVGANPGTYGSGGIGSAYTITPASVNPALPTVYHTVFAFPQGPAPAGGADAGNTPAFQGYITSDKVLHVTSISAGIIAAGMGGTITCSAGCTGFSTGTKLAGFLTGVGYTGTYSVDTVQTVGSSGSPSTFAANGCVPGSNTPTWDNWVTTTCVGTTAYFNDLVTYLHSHYGVPLTQMYYFGHSNGGFNGQRLMRESPGLFAAYGLLAPPASTYYNQYSVIPGTVAPIWLTIGDQDTTLDTNCALVATCTGTKNLFTGYLATGSPGKLHVTAQTSGTETKGAVVNCPGSQDGTYISGTLSTDPGDVATYSVTISQSTVSGSCNAGNMFDALWYQNSANSSFADLTEPLHAVEIGLMYTTAQWANLYCSGGYAVPLDPAMATTMAVTHGVQRTFSPCSDFVHLQELSNAGHPIYTMTQAMGARPLNQYMAWLKTHFFAGDMLYLYADAANEPVFIDLTGIAA